MNPNVPVRYVASKALFSFLGSTFRINAPDGGLRYYVKQKAFRLKEELLVYADEARSEVLLKIKARSISDARGFYDVHDASGEKVGAAKRNLLKSILVDDWDLMGPDDAPLGKLKEKASFLTFLRKWLKIIPQTYVLEVAGTKAGEIKQRFHPFRLVYDIEIGEDLDERLGVAATVLILAIESKRD